MPALKIIAIGGGKVGRISPTLRMMKTWRRHGVDAEIRAAMKRGAVLCGSSAGSIAWFAWGNSDSLMSAANPTKLIRVRGLGFVNALLCPHYDTEKHRRPSLKAMTKRHRQVAIALDECCAMVIVDDSYRILSSVKGRNAYRVCWRGGVYREERLDQSPDFSPLGPLLAGNGCEITSI